MSNEVSSLLAAPIIVAARFDPVLALTALISASFVGANKVPPEKVPPLITGIHQTLAALAKASNGHADGNGASSPDHTPLTRGLRGAVPAIDVKKSLFPDHLVCIECARKLTTMKRHLAEVHELTPERYRTKWKLPDTYPMVAPEYAKARSAMAKKMGLGSKRR